MDQNEHPHSPARRKRPGRLRRVVGLMTIAASAYIAVCVLIYLFQARLVYFPSAEYHSTPADIGLAFEDVTFTTSDGLNIAAWYVPSSIGGSQTGTVLFCHGNAGNLSDRLVTIRILHSLGCNVLIFDYRGYGRSAGKPDEQGTYRDAEAAWEYLVNKRGVSPRRLILCGRSLGGAVAVQLATQHPPAALVVESSFTSLVDVARVHYRWLPARLLCRFHYDSAARVATISCPKLFLHATDDELIPIEIGRRLYQAAAPPKRFIETPGGHNTGGFTHSPAYSRQLATFLAETLDPESV